MSGPETVEYRVRREDCLERIVSQAGFPARDWRRIYNAPYNRSFRRRRPDPNLILPGDIVTLPRYSPRDLAQMVRRIETLKGRFTRLGRGISETEREISNAEARLRREREMSQEQIVQISRRINHLESLVSEATDTCEDEWTCLGGGMAAQRFINEQQTLERQIRSIEGRRAVSADKANRALRDMRRSLTRMQRAQAGTAGEIQSLHRSRQRALQNPY